MLVFRRLSWLCLAFGACGVPHYTFDQGSAGASGSAGSGGGGTNGQGGFSAGGNGNGGEVAASGAAGQSATEPAFTYEPFTVTPGALNGKGSGFGWASGSTWAATGGSTTDPTATDLMPLTFGMLDGNASYARGSMGVSAGRKLDNGFSGPWGDYLSNSVIGKSGKEVWISALLRLDATNTSDTALVLHAASDPNMLDAPRISIGYFGAASQDAGTKYWSLRLGSQVLRSGVAIDASAALLVVRVTFGSPSLADLFVDSALGTTPMTPDASGSAADLKFGSVAYLPGTGSALDEIRIGPSYASVTPLSN